MDRLEAMAAFRAVVERGGFAAAGTALGRSKSGISKQVSTLEAHVGAQLLVRSTRRVALTEAGAAYFDECVNILDAIAAMEDRAIESSVQPRGVLRINAPLSWGVTRLAPAAARFLAAHPAIRLDLTFDDRRLHPLEGGFDLSLRIASALDDSELSVRRIGAICHAVCASPDYLAHHSGPIHPGDLASHRLLVYVPRAGALQYRFRPQADDQKDVAVAVTAALTANSSLCIREALLAGAGIAVIPRFVVADDLREGRLVELLKDWRLPEHALHAIFAGRRRLPAKTRAFIDFLVAERSMLVDD